MSRRHDITGAANMHILKCHNSMGRLECHDGCHVIVYELLRFITLDQAKLLKSLTRPHLGAYEGIEARHEEKAL